MEISLMGIEELRKVGDDQKSIQTLQPKHNNRNTLTKEQAEEYAMSEHGLKMSHSKVISQDMLAMSQRDKKKGLMKSGRNKQ